MAWPLVALIRSVFGHSLAGLARLSAELQTPRGDGSRAPV